MIPKIIWTYWDNPEIPEFIKDCINTWKKYCKDDWSIMILNKNTIKLFLQEDIDFPKTVWYHLAPHQSDMFGVSLINKYGGVWMDANIIMLNSIDFILKKDWFSYCTQNGDFQIFLFASIKNSYTIKKIHTIFYEIFSMNEIERRKVLIDKYKKEQTYFFTQNLITYLIKNDIIIQHTILQNSIDPWNTIYKLIVLLFHNNIRDKDSVVNFLQTKTGTIPLEILNEPLIKLQGASQQINTLSNFSNYSWWHQLVKK